MRLLVPVSANYIPQEQISKKTSDTRAATTQPVLGRVCTVRRKLDLRMVLGVRDGVDQLGARLVTSPEFTSGGRSI